MGAYAIELELRIRLDEVVVGTDLCRNEGSAVRGPQRQRTHLYRPVPSTLDPQPDALSPLIQRNRACLAFDRDDGTWLLRCLVHVGIGQRKHVLGGDRQERSIQRLLEIAVVGGDGMVHGDEVGARGEGALDHEFGERGDDGGLDMAATEHGLAHGHEVRDHVLAIANELYAFRKRTTRSCTGSQGPTSCRLFAIRA
jgi:hypothetical protein